MQEKQKKIKTYAEQIRSFYMSQKRMPTYSELLRVFGLKSKNAVAKRLRRLIERGFLTKDASGHIIPQKIFSPLRVLGTIAAGFPSPAEEELADTMSLDDYLISNPQATYLLRVEGDSMLDAGIHPGDLVLVQRNLTPKTGDIVVAEVDGEWTMKYLEKRGKKCHLRPGNKKYPDISPQVELVIAGVVIANLRKYR